MFLGYIVVRGTDMFDPEDRLAEDARVNKDTTGYFPGSSPLCKPAYGPTRPHPDAQND